MERSLNSLVKGTFVTQGIHNQQSRQKVLENLLIHKKLPKFGLSNHLIQFVVDELAILDSNNFLENIGVGEREGRVFSSLVRDRHCQLSHGIGRSGDLTEVQPKAAGSSAIYKLTTNLASHALSISGLNNSKNCIILPLATGMTLAMCMITLKSKHPISKYVIWSRIDQKSCFKSILTAGLIPLVVDCKLLDNGEMITDLDKIEMLLAQYNEEVLCVLSTTSCFAPRQPDLVANIAALCETYNRPHIINNAYGLQCSKITKLINRAMVKGRVDGVVQSTDKNFMVPVGGALVVSPDASFIQNVSGIYPGRASMSPILDLLMTLLAMGESGYSALLADRERLVPTFKEGLSKVTDKFSLTVLPSAENNISFAINIDELVALEHSLTFIGSMLFVRNVSGCRVISTNNCVTCISGYNFCNWGSHSDSYPHNYFTVACSIGLKEIEVLTFLERLNKVLTKYIKCKKHH